MLTNLISFFLLKKTNFSNFKNGKIPMEIKACAGLKLHILNLLNILINSSIEKRY